jgi:hypothetical protein
MPFRFSASFLFPLLTDPVVAAAAAAAPGSGLGLREEDEEEEEEVEAAVLEDGS